MLISQELNYKFYKCTVKDIKSSVKRLRKRSLNLIENRNIENLKINSVSEAEQLCLSCLYNDEVLYKMSENINYHILNIQNEIYGFLIELFQILNNDEINNKEFENVFQMRTYAASFLAPCSYACWFLERQLPFYKENNISPAPLIQIVVSVSFFACNYCNDFLKNINKKHFKKERRCGSK